MTATETDIIRAAYRDHNSRDAARERVNEAIVQLRLDALDLVRYTFAQDGLVDYRELSSACEQAKGEIRSRFSTKGLRRMERVRITIDPDADEREVARLAMQIMEQISQSHAYRSFDDMAPEAPGWLTTCHHLRAHLPQGAAPELPVLADNAPILDRALLAKLEDIARLRTAFGAMIFATQPHGGISQVVSNDLYSQLHSMIWRARLKSAERAFMLGMLTENNELRQLAISAYLGFYENVDHASVMELTTRMGAPIGRYASEDSEQLRAQMRAGIARLRKG
jgi:hypothetical protein